MKNVEQFFNEYAFATLNGNASEIANFYAGNFMVCSRNDSAAFKNDQKFIEWLNNLFEFNKKVGLQKLKAIDIDAVSIGEYYTRATVTWASTFAKTPDEEIIFDIHYILNHLENDLKIVLYITEVDQEELMKEKDLI